MQFKGTYVFKQDGVEIGRSENLITASGRKIILQYLSGVRNEWASDMCIGAINTAPTVLDTQLNFETLRIPVTLKTYKSATDSDPDLIVVRGTLPATMYANIYEIGIYPSSNVSEISSRSNKILTDFYDLSNWVANINDQSQSIDNQGSVYVTGFIPQGSASPRIGGYCVDIIQNTTYTNNSFSFSLQGYSDIDTLDILASNTAAGQLVITLTDSNSATYSFNYTLSDNPNYQVLSVPFPSNIIFTNTITSISIATDNTAAINIDAIKASNYPELTNEDFIISKSVLETPIAKIYGTPLDVEYYIQVL